MWCRIQILYPKKLSPKKRRAAQNLCIGILRTLRPISYKCFFLFEIGWTPSHMLISFKPKNKKYKPLINLIEKKVGKKRFVFRENSPCGANGDLFVDLMDAWCEKLSENRFDFFRQQPCRKRGLKRIHHILHCMMNMITGSRSSEVKIYKQMFNWYGAKKHGKNTIRKSTKSRR